MTQRRLLHGVKVNGRLDEPKPLSIFSTQLARTSEKERVWGRWVGRKMRGGSAKVHSIDRDNRYTIKASKHLVVTLSQEGTPHDMSPGCLYLYKSAETSRCSATHQQMGLHLEME